jgi:hypothetical protein
MTEWRVELEAGMRGLCSAPSLTVKPLLVDEHLAVLLGPCTACALAGSVPGLGLGFKVPC